MRAPVGLVAAVMLDGCGPARTTPVETPPVENLVAHVDPYCPPIPGLGPWQFEVFPACPPPPIDHGVHVCEPGECPRPCTMSSDIADDMGLGPGPSRWWFRYDERGRWIETRDAADAADPVSSCTWKDDHIDHCRLVERTARAERDATGRLVRVIYDRPPEAATSVEPPDRLVDRGATPATVFAVTYVARGEVVAVGESTLRYDQRGRLAGFVLAGDVVPRQVRGETTLERDASGTVVREIGPFEVRTFTYEADGRRVREAITKKKPWRLASDATPPPSHDAITTAGAVWTEDEICMDCENGAEAPVKDPETERREMLEYIERRANIFAAVYEGTNLLHVARGERGPRQRSHTYSYQCPPAK